MKNGEYNKNKKSKDEHVDLNMRAVALGYDIKKDSAPTIKAKGKGYIADDIIKRAKTHNIPIQEDASLVEILSQLEINERIPANLYEVVAEVFAFIYRVDQEQRK